MTKTQYQNSLAALLSGLLLASAAIYPNLSRGEEPPPVCPKCSSAERGIPMLSKIPFVSRLFKNVGSQEIERIGVDFDIEVCQDCPVECQAPAVACQQGARPQLFVFRRSPQGATLTECLESGRCCANEPCCGEDCEERSACCQETCETVNRSGPSWEHVVELSAKNAALEAMLEAQEAFHKEKSEMLGMLAELCQEKAKLEAKVESQAHHAELTKEMLALASENGRLKAQVEMAEAKLSLVQEMVKVALENERLKLALQTRHAPKQLVGDVEYLPPAPEANSNRLAPAKRATFQDVETPVYPQPKLER